MILAAPLVIPFAKAVPALAGIMGGIGMAALSDRVNEYIQENPEESMKILSTIIPNVGIGQIFMSKEDKISLENWRTHPYNRIAFSKVDNILPVSYTHLTLPTKRIV